MVEAAKRAEATIIDVVFHEFNPFGISGVVVIAESHLSIHTWPEHRYAAVDIFSCGETLKPAEAAPTTWWSSSAPAGPPAWRSSAACSPALAGLANRVKEGIAPNGAQSPYKWFFETTTAGRGALRTR